MELPKPTEEALEKMRKLGGEWAAYQNHDLGSPDIGHIQYLKIGEDATFKTPPPRYPDTHLGPGWRYVYVGRVNLETGLIEPPTAETKTEDYKPDATDILWALRMVAMITDQGILMYPATLARYKVWQAVKVLELVSPEILEDPEGKKIHERTRKVFAAIDWEVIP